MTDYQPRLFASHAEIEHLGEGLLACTLRREEWTHEAHLAATSYLLLRRPEINLDRALPGIIRAFNESVGGVNSDSEGYHETITRVFLHGVRLFLAERGTVPEGTVPASLHELVNELLRSPMGHREWPLHYYTAERLLSVEARRQFVDPDIVELPPLTSVSPIDFRVQFRR